MTPGSVPDAVVIRPASGQDASAIAAVEASARRLLHDCGVDLDALELPHGFEETISWDLALVAEIHDEVVGMTRCSDLGDGWLALDQISVLPGYARQGIGRRLLNALVVHASERGFRTITGTTFRTLPFNAPFYAGLSAVEDTDPHPVMAQRRRIERQIGLDNFGPRLVMRLRIDH